ncbi:serine/threonine-protein kinase [Luteimonas sp. J29]|jgi:tetratricopeptide (TPR) repeat protein|uniref:serine/threonine-protein kinase n=1 Tax=Luteimonas sp. J29 TaxID=935863 RepID=UPI00047BA227|nr:serine/threonine-protein kinase [Luteimonas sp. J29]
MEAARWQEVRRLFDAVCEEPPARWTQRLHELGGDPALVAEVLALLQAQTVSFERAVRPLGELVESLAGDELEPGARLGPWVLEQRLASGGMGTVWVAGRADGLFRQRVAIKLLRGGVLGAAAAERLAAERQILAGLQHPGIARLYDGGTTPAGHPYLVMEYVDGLPLDAYCERHVPGLRERLRLFLRVCAPVQAAHARLVVHCDLKPSNVLVREGGEPVLLDFGIAQLLGESGQDIDPSGYCTLHWASPEQRRGERVGVASDVFSLGVLLTGLLAATGTVRSGDDPDAPVPLPSALAGNGCPWRHLLRGDLDAIAARACAIDPRARYPSVQELAADIAAWLDTRPVAAAGGGRGYRARLFLRRHRWGVAASALAVFALLAGAGVALWQAQQARVQRDAALVEGAKTRAMLEFMTGLFAQADPAAAHGRELTARELLQDGLRRIRSRFGDQPEVRAELLGAMSAAHRGLGDYDTALPLADEALDLARGAGNQVLADTQALNRARVLHHLGRFADVLELLDPLQARHDGQAGDRRLASAVAHARAMALQALGRGEDAEQAYLQALRLRRGLPGETRAGEETAMRLVSLYTLQQRYEEAEALARSTLAQVRASTPPPDPHLAEAIGTLAMVLGNTGPAAEAEALRREELAIAEAGYGPDHPETQGARNDLASVLYTQGRLDEAAAIFADVLAARLRHYGDAHPLVATAANNLANVELALRRPAEAMAHVRQALDIRLQVYGPTHHTTATSWHTLGIAAMELGDAAAVDHLARAVDAWEAAAGADSGHLVAPLRDLARAQLLFGHPDHGCVAIARARRIAGSQSPAQAAYAQALADACRVATGEPDATRAFADSRKALEALAGPGDPLVQRLAAIARGLGPSARR